MIDYKLVLTCIINAVLSILYSHMIVTVSKNYLNIMIFINYYVMTTCFSFWITVRELEKAVQD